MRSASDPFSLFIHFPFVRNFLVSVRATFDSHGTWQESILRPS